MLLQEREMSLDHLLILLSALEHDRTLDHRHDIARQRQRIHGPPRTALACSGIQIRLELPGHLIETLGQPPAKPIVSITKRRAEIADHAAPLALVPPADHLLDRVQPAEDSL